MATAKQRATKARKAIILLEQAATLVRDVERDRQGGLGADFYEQAMDDTCDLMRDWAREREREVQE